MDEAHLNAKFSFNSAITLTQSLVFLPLMSARYRTSGCTRLDHSNPRLFFRFGLTLPARRKHIQSSSSLAFFSRPWLALSLLMTTWATPNLGFAANDLFQGRPADEQTMELRQKIDSLESRLEYAIKELSQRASNPAQSETSAAVVTTNREAPKREESPEERQRQQISEIAIEQIIASSHTYMGTLNGKHIVKQKSNVLALTPAEYKAFLAQERALARLQLQRMMTASAEDIPSHIPSQGLSDTNNVILLLKDLPPPTLPAQFASALQAEAATVQATETLEPAETLTTSAASFPASATASIPAKPSAQQQSARAMVRNQSVPMK